MSEIKNTDNAVRIREFIDARKNEILDDVFGLMKIDS